MCQYPTSPLISLHYSPQVAYYSMVKRKRLPYAGSTVILFVTTALVATLN